MAQSADDPGQDKYSRLNEIARGRPSGEFFDHENVSKEEFETVCNDIIESVEHVVEDFADGTVYTRRQAQAYVLRQKVAYPTQLTANAVGVLIGWWENKDSPIGEGNVAKMANQAEDKGGKAWKTTFVETTDRTLRKHLDHEVPVWVDYQTRQALQGRSREGETPDELIQRLLTESQSVRSLRDVLEEIIENYPVADMQVSHELALSPATFTTTREDPASLQIDVSVSKGQEGNHDIEDAVDHGTVFKFDEYYFTLTLIPAAEGSEFPNSIQIYASNDIMNIEPVTLDEGLERLETAIEE